MKMMREGPRNLKKCLLMAGIMMLASVAIISSARPVKASSSVLPFDYIHYGWAGYNDNSTIYMVKSINSTSSINSTRQDYIFPAFNVTQNQSASSNIYGVRNSIDLTSGTNKFSEFYNNVGPSGPYLQVGIPVATSGYEINSSRSTALVQLQNISLLMNDSYEVQALIQTSNNTMLNDTLYNGTVNKQIYLEDMMLNGLYLFNPFPWVGRLRDLSNIYQDYQLYTANTKTPTYHETQTNGNTEGIGTVYETFQVNNTGTGGPATYENTSIYQNVFGAAAPFTVEIYPDQFTSTHYITVRAQNLVGGTASPGADYVGAQATLTIAAVPAFEVSGTAYLGSNVPYANAWVYLGQQGSGIAYAVKTNSNGEYRFFAPLNTGYSLYASYGTPFGTASTTVNFSTGSPGGYEYENIHVGGVVEGYIRSSSTGAGIAGATVSIVNNSGQTESVTTGSGGFYRGVIYPSGTYSVDASKSGYYSAGTTTQANLYQDAWVNISLTPEPSGGGGGGGGSGGCVLFGTMVYLGNGQEVPVQDVVTGDKIMSYDILSSALSVSELTIGVVTAVHITNVTQIVDINNGMLFVSGLTVQPLFGRFANGTSAPILLGKLNKTMDLYDALNNTWIPVTSIQMVTGNFTVYDIVVSAPFASGNTLANNYVTGVGVPMILKRP